MTVNQTLFFKVNNLEKLRCLLIYVLRSDNVNITGYICRMIHIDVIQEHAPLTMAALSIHHTDSATVSTLS